MIVEAGLPIERVTLFEDRAHVVRRGRVALPAGAVVVQVSGISPVIADRTLHCRLVSGPEGATVVEARVRRLRLLLAADRPEEARELEERLRAVDREIAASDAALEALRRDVAALKDVRTQTLADLSHDAAWGRGAASDWRAHLAQVAARERAAREALADRQVAREALDLRRRELAALLAARRRPDQQLRTAVEVQLSVPAAGDAELELGYTVPSACWRPAHTARLTGGKVALSSDACVWQNTGEDWVAVRLAFSTQRLSRGVEPPPLTSDVVAVQRKEKQMVVEAREQEVATTGLGGVRTVSEVPGIDDGGETRHLEAPAPASVPSDGRPYRVPLFGFEAPATVSRVAIAELSLAVHLKSEQANAAGRPLLPGPVELVRESGFVGRTALGFVAPGEKFALGWGPDASLRVHRDHAQVEEQTTLMNALSAWTNADHRVNVRLSNIGDEPQVIEVTERVPVSEVEKVQVVPEPKETTQGTLPDRDGFVRWTLTVRPDGHEEVRLGYRLRRHRDVARGVES